MTTYYKATRRDATSLRDGHTRWAVGERVTIPEPTRRTTLCEAGLLHVSDAAAETLVGGSWPCRLFQVVPGEIVASEGHKHGTHSVRVVRELQSWRAPGPNGRAVAAVIERAGRLTEEERARLTAASGAAYAAWGAARAAAWAAAGGAARAAARAAVTWPRRTARTPSPTATCSWPRGAR